MRGLDTAANTGCLKGRRSWRPAGLRQLYCLLAAVLATILSVVPASQAMAGSVTIDSVRIRPSPERTRIVFDLSAPVEHKVFALTNPRRLVIDIDNANLD